MEVKEKRETIQQQLKGLRENFSAEEILFLKLLYESISNDKVTIGEQKTEEKLKRLMKRMVATGYFHSFANICRVKDNILAKSRNNFLSHRYVC